MQEAVLNVAGPIRMEGGRRDLLRNDGASARDTVIQDLAMPASRFVTVGTVSIGASEFHLASVVVEDEIEKFLSNRVSKRPSNVTIDEISLL